MASRRSLSFTEPSVWALDDASGHDADSSPTAAAGSTHGGMTTIEELEEQTMGKFSLEQADKVFGPDTGDDDAAIATYSRETRQKLDEMRRRESYFASAFRDSSSSGAMPPATSRRAGNTDDDNDEDEEGGNEHSGQQQGSAVAAPPPSLGPLSRYNTTIDGSISSIVRPEYDAPKTKESYLIDKELKDPAQQYVHIHLVGRHVPPKCDVPGVRICGAWPSVDDVRRRVVHMHKVDNRPTHLCWPAHKFRLLASSIEHLNDPVYVRRKKHEILAKYHENRVKAARLFAEKTAATQGSNGNVVAAVDDGGGNDERGHSKGSSSRTTKKNKKKDTKRHDPLRIVTEETIERREERRKRTLRNKTFNAIAEQHLADGKTDSVDFPDTFRISDQRFAAVIFVPDLTAVRADDDPEPLFRFLRAFGTIEACEAYVERVAQHHYSDYHIDIVDMYEMLFPTEVKAKDIDETFRHGELTNIIKRQKVERNKVMSYEEWCRSKNRVAPTLDIPLNQSPAQ